MSNKDKLIYLIVGVISSNKHDYIYVGEDEHGRLIFLVEGMSKPDLGLVIGELYEFMDNPPKIVLVEEEHELFRDLYGKGKIKHV